MEYKIDITHLFAHTLQVEKLSRVYWKITGIDIRDSDSELQILEQKLEPTNLERDLLESIKILNEIKQLYFDSKKH